MTRFDGVRFYVVTVDGVENDDVAVAAIGGDGESAGLVAVEASFDVGDRHVDVVRAIIERSLRNSGHRIWVGNGASGPRASALLVHVAHFCLIDDLDEFANAFGGEAWPPFEVASVDGFAPRGGFGKTHCGVVELDELIGVLTFIDAVREEGWHFDGGGGVVVGFVGGDDIVGLVRDEGDTPHVRAHIAPPSDNSFTIEGDFTTMHVEEDIAASVAEDGDGNKVVGDGGGFVGFSCCAGQFGQEEFESVGGEHFGPRGLDYCFGRQLCGGYRGRG